MDFGDVKVPSVDVVSRPSTGPVYKSVVPETPYIRR